jgi:CHAT domain-containing protein
MTLLIVACAGPGHDGPRAEAPSNSADSLFTRGAYDSAQTAFSAALAAPGVRGSLQEARILAKLGLVAWRRGDYRTARTLGDSALSLKQRRGASPQDLAESRNGLGLMAWEEGRLADAKRLLGQALVEYREAGDQRGIAKASNNLGLLDIESGRFAEAHDQFELARTTGRTLNDARITGRATTNLAMVELASGDPRVAVALVDEARSMARRANDPVNEEDALGQLSLAWAALGDAGRALATADSALSVARGHGMREKQASDLLVLATLYALTGEADRAIQHYEASRVLYDSLELSTEAATVLRHEALLRASRGAYTQASRVVERALTQHRASDARLETFYDLLALADIDVQAGNLVLASRAVAEAERTAADFGGPNVRASLALARARVHDARHESAGVLAELGAAEADLAVADAESRLDAFWLRMRAHAALGQIDAAVAAARRTEAAIAQVGSTLASLTLRLGYRTERHRALADVVLVLLRAGAPEDAFRVAESVRGEALRADMARARNDLTGVPLGLTSVERAERERVLREIDALVSRLAELSGRPHPERGVDWASTNDALTGSIREARARYEALVLRQTEAAGSAGRRLADTSRLDVDALRGVLRPREALVEYYVTPDTLVTFVVTRERLRVIAAPVSRDDLDRRVRLVRGLLGTPNGGDRSREALEAMYAILVRPLVDRRALDGVTQLLVVPHGALSRLPFAALTDAATAHRLVEDFLLEELPTAGILPRLRRAAPGSRPAAAAVFAPFPERLPASRHEVDAVARLVPNAIVYHGGAATESQLRRALAGPGRVHVASHGEFLPSTPGFSSVLLARGRTGSDDDGRLDLHEVLDMRVRSPLVFLSGCETAMGSAGVTAFERAEDVATLAEAFVLSGAGGVVATLWRIDDDGAAYFAERFYTHLATMATADALAAAQRDLMHESRWSNPYYWAGYTLAGDGDSLGTE